MPSEPDDLLTPKRAEKVRFRISKPSGYYAPDVEAFIEGALKNSLDWYIEAIYQRDLALSEMEKQVAQLRTRATQNEIAEGTNSVTKDSEMLALLNRAQTAEEKVALLQQTVSEREQRIKEFEEYAEKVEPYMEQIRNGEINLGAAESGTGVSNEEVERLLAEKDATIAEMAKYIEDIQPYLQQLESTADNAETEEESYESAEIEISETSIENQAEALSLDEDSDADDSSESEDDFVSVDYTPKSPSVESVETSVTEQDEKLIEVDVEIEEEPQPKEQLTTEPDNYVVNNNGKKIKLPPGLSVEDL